MAEAPIPTVRRHAAVLVTAVVGIAVLLILLYSVGGVLADRKRSRMLDGWSRNLGSFEQILARYPAREVNDSALRVEELAAVLGIEIPPRGAAGRSRPTAAAAERYRQAKRVVFDYADSQLEREDAALDPPPDAAVRFLELNREPLDALRDHLLHGDAPAWALHLREPYDAPVPNLLGFSNLQRLLVADALSRASAGDREAALSTLDAAWRLNAGLQEIPLLIAQLIAMSSTRQHLGALRHIEGPPGFWRDRLDEHDYRATMLTALQLEGWGWIRALDPRAVEESERSSPSFLYSIARPYMSYCVSDVGDDWRRRLERLAEVESYCDRDLSAAEIDLALNPPSWNLLGQITFGGLSDVPRRVARYELDREMTARLLDLQAARDSLAGRWPASLPGPAASSICPGDRWVYENSAGGAASLAFSRDVDWAGLRGIDLPLRYVAKP